MLILTRKLGEHIAIGDEIRVTILDIKGKNVRLGIEAPQGVAVHRGEVYRMIQEENLKAVLFDGDVTGKGTHVPQKETGALSLVKLKEEGKL